METEPTNNSKKALGISISVIVLVIIAFVVFAENKKPDVVVVPTPSSPAPTTPIVPPSSPATPIDTPKTKTTMSTYTDGTYTAIGSYMSPGGPDKISVTLTLKSDIVTDVSITPQPGDNTSSRYQNIFAANYKQYVIGKNISTLSLSKVSGSSLTGRGFNDAIAQIKTQAKA